MKKIKKAKKIHFSILWLVGCVLVVLGSFFPFFYALGVSFPFRKYGVGFVFVFLALIASGILSFFRRKLYATIMAIIGFFPFLLYFVRVFTAPITTIGIGGYVMLLGFALVGVGILMDSKIIVAEFCAFTDIIGSLNTTESKMMSNGYDSNSNMMSNGTNPSMNPMNTNSSMINQNMENNRINNGMNGDVNHPNH